MTGRVIIHAPQRSRRSMSGVISPGAATYSGTEYIMACIMPKPATIHRQSSRRAARVRGAASSRSPAGTAP